MAAPAAPPPGTSRLRLVATMHDIEPPIPTSDEAILSAFHLGERGVGLGLYEHLFPVVDRTLYRIFGRREHDHADLVQAVFEQIVGTLAKRRFAGQCSLAGWASAIACHVGLTALRSRRRERHVIDRGPEPEVTAEVPSRRPDPEREVSAQRDLMAVRRHLSEMDPDRSTALLLHAMGHSLSEVAELTGVSVVAAQSRLSRARRDLEARYEAELTRDDEREGPESSERLR